MFDCHSRNHEKGGYGVFQLNWIDICVAIGPNRAAEPNFLNQLEQQVIEQPREIGLILFFDANRASLDVKKRIEERGVWNEVKVLGSHAGIGWINARNVMAASSNADLLIFLDDDLSFVEIDFDEIQINTGPDFSGSSGTLINEEGALKSGLSHWKREPGKISPIDTEGLSVISRERFLSVGGFGSPAPNAPAHEGLDLSFKLALEFGFRSLRKRGFIHGGHKASFLKSRSEVPGFVHFPNRIGIREINIIFRIVADFYDRLSPEPSSVVTTTALFTVKNTSFWLQNIIENIQRQTMTPDQVVIIIDDDYPTSKAQELFASQCPEINFSIIANPRSGRGAALNLGVREATEDYILIFDADDYYLPDRVKDTVSFIRSQKTNPDWIPSLALLNNGDSLSLWPRKVTESRDEIARILGSGNSPFSFPGFAFRNRIGVWEEFSETLSSAVDFDWYLRNLDKAKCVSGLNMITHVYRPGPDSITNRLQIKQYANAKVRGFLSGYAFRSLKKKQRYQRNQDNQLIANMELEEIMNSKSWKITAPLRALYRLMLAAREGISWRRN